MEEGQRLTPIEVLCHHTKDGEIVPIRFRMAAEDGELHTYSVRNFREIDPKSGAITTKDNVYISPRIRYYECEILSFGRTMTVRLYYDREKCSWRLGA